MEISKNFLIEEYSNKLKSINAIHEEFDIPKKVIGKYLKIYNIPILSKYDRVERLYKDKVVEDYTINKKSLTEISKKYKIAPKTIKRILASNNINILDSNEMSGLKNRDRCRTNRKYQMNFDYFKTWSADMAYILGLIYADGNISYNKIKIALKKGDSYLLEEIKNKLEYEGDIYYSEATCNNKKFETAILTINSIDMCEDLCKLGVVENKSLKIKFPHIPKEYVLDFIRGYFDGDGSIEIRKQDSSHQLRTRFCSGSLEFLTELMNKLCEYKLNPKNIYKKKNSNCYDLAYSTKESLKIYYLLYNSKECICLKRKKDKFDYWIKIRNK